MGSAPRVHEDLIHVRGWTRGQIKEVHYDVRSDQSKYWITKDGFVKYFGGRSREAVSIFNHLDTDYDGKVDIFEVLVMLLMWSGIAWSEKVELLFEVFDLMNKGFLKVDEVLFMATIILQTFKKFVDVNAEHDNMGTLKEMSEKAFSRGKGHLTFEMFRSWTSNNDTWQELKAFFDERMANGTPEPAPTLMELKITFLGEYAETLLSRIEQIQDRLPEFTEEILHYVSLWSRRKRWDFIMQNLRQTILKVQQYAEQMLTRLSQLEQGFRDDQADVVPASHLDPGRRFRQEQWLIEVERLRQQSQVDYRDMTELLKQLTDLTDPESLKGPMDENDGLSSFFLDENGVFEYPAHVNERRMAVLQIQTDMVEDMLPGGALNMLPPQGSDFSSSVLAALGDGREIKVDGGARPEEVPEAPADYDVHTAVLLAIADFDPPPEEGAQMLRLAVHDIVEVLGQDGRGWWFGRKLDGSEGWFPPSYVQVRS
eukprot:gnl/TRDRNA2_/TRDRNA2_177256_c0_seq1.p1 gnl/TRDRNA2_/TRDRNA2_177256_c0~~gnl/TRDRNA2_/TRDRNA2_177256_c0_seq1.p1  ORF type:complete len:483 (-),score=105.03 gnl/TRDRNA2_/TRDRNA2_177256_c0_seq1:100-1548(-)